jgi:hypothetical protein
MLPGLRRTKPACGNQKQSNQNRNSPLTKLDRHSARRTVSIAVCHIAPEARAPPKVGIRCCIKGTTAGFNRHLCIGRLATQGFHSPAPGIEEIVQDARRRNLQGGVYVTAESGVTNQDAVKLHRANVNTGAENARPAQLVQRFGDARPVPCIDGGAVGQRAARLGESAADQLQGPKQRVADD